MNRTEPVQRTHEGRAPAATSVARPWFLGADVFERDLPSRDESSRPIDEVDRNRDDALFLLHRARLLRIACRMLGSRNDAQDIVQDVYLRWRQSVKRDIESPIAFLITMTRRLCVDRLRELKRQRTESLETASTEPDDQAPSPEVQIELTEDVSGGVLTVFQRLNHEERAAFLLHDVFDYGYTEVGRLLGRAETACRQIVHRARARLRGSRARFVITPECHRRVLEKFLAAVGGDREAIRALLAEEVDLRPRG